jgi:hypothetical protein
MARWLILLLLAGCTPQSAPKPADIPKKLKVIEGTIKAAGGEITTVNVPVRSMGDAREFQVCFVWRDGNTQSSTMQCPNDRQTFTIDPH